jgi:hypothetical protein
VGLSLLAPRSHWGLGRWWVTGWVAFRWSPDPQTMHPRSPGKINFLHIFAKNKLFVFCISPIACWRSNARPSRGVGGLIYILVYIYIYIYMLAPKTSTVRSNASNPIAPQQKTEALLWGTAKCLTGAWLARTRRSDCLWLMFGAWLCSPWCPPVGCCGSV